MTKSKSSWLAKAEPVILWLAIFLLPWQWRHTFLFDYVGGIYFEYSSWHIYAVDVAILVLLGIWLWRKNRSISTGPKFLAWPLLAWLGWATASILWAGDMAVAILTAAHMWLFFAFYLYIVNEIKDWRTVMWPLIWSVGVQAVWGIVQFATNSSLGMNWLGESILDPTKSGIPVVEQNGVRQLRAHGMLPHANILGGWLVAVLPLVYYWYAQAKSALSRRISLIAIGLAIIAVVLSFSRAAWIVLAMVLIALAIVWWRTKNKPNVYLVGVSILLLVATLATQAGYVTGRISGEGALEERSVSERVDGFNYWQVIYADHQDRGVGIGNYLMGVQEAEPGQLGWWYQPVHNIYLLVAGELGAIGSAIWLWLIGAIVWMGYWMIKKRLETIIFLAPTLALLALGLVDHWILSLQQGRLLLFVSLAMAVIGYEIAFKKRQA